MATNNRGCDYAELWAMYKRQDEFNDDTARNYQAQILHWMDLKRTLPTLSWRTQLEVLDNAPMPIIKAHSTLLHDQTKKSLGLEVEKKKNHNKSFGKEFSFFR